LPAQWIPCSVSGYGWIKVFEEPGEGRERMRCSPPQGAIKGCPSNRTEEY